MKCSWQATGRLMFLLLLAWLCWGVGGISPAIAIEKKTKRADYYPDIKLKTQDGNEVRLYEDLIKGKTVVVHFFYSRCEGKLCDEGLKNLERLQKDLGDALGKDVFIYSITLDPEHDTPAVLKKTAEAHNAKPGWIFLTGGLEDITALRKKIGFVDSDPKKEADLTQHTGMIKIINDPFFRFSSTSVLNRPERIAQMIKDMTPVERPKAVKFNATPNSPRAANEASLAKVKEFFAKFGQGDIPGVLNTMSSEVDWFIPGPNTIPYAGTRKGKEEVGKFFTAFSESVEVQDFQPKEFITQQYKVVVLGHEVLKVKSTGKVVKNEWAMVFVVQNDKITQFRSYEDTAALVASFAK